VAAAITLYVDDATCPAAGTGTQADPYCRIQDAICLAVSGDTVSVAPGTYLEAIRMRPGVSVLSQGGAAVTTIDAAGKPCTDNTFCAKRTGNQCSVVTFSDSHTPATRLEGFTVTGGAGLIQSQQVNGGGIFIFSSPTVLNNVITGNVLAGPRDEYNGAGIFVNSGAPVISNNTITGNRAVPGPGTAAVTTYGYGGGVWVGHMADPILTNNIIEDNVAGDPNLNESVGCGGGLAILPGAAGRPGPRLDRNLIAGNSTDTYGGGICLNSLGASGAPAVVTNNVIIGNTSGRNGGGVYTYFNRSTIVNNTMTDNLAFLGGGLYSGQNPGSFPVSITNNIIVGNRLFEFGQGGGIYTLDINTSFDPVIAYNDLFGNEVTQVAGDKTDAQIIGDQGNFSADPLFLNRSAGDLRIGDPNSPVIDVALASAAPPVDRTNAARGFDGNGIPNDPQPGDVDVGAYEFRGSVCTPGPEVCDGADNNCNSAIDEGFLDSDSDDLANCVDPDDDNDFAPDPSDCAPLDPTAFGVPFEIANLAVTGTGPTTLTYDAQNIGTGTHYEILSGLISRLRVIRSFQEDFCLDRLSLFGGTWIDQRPATPVGDGWFYLIRSVNACGIGTLGSALADAPGAGDVCLNFIWDLDFDGSPSDLDCNDNDARRSPIKPEICDAVDNDCDQVVDEGNPGGGATCGTDVGECRSGTMTCTAGSLVCAGAVGPTAEVCDGLDNNCDGSVDNTVDTDLDGLDDCVDPDDDNDSAADGSDCAPRDATAFGVPTEVQGLDVIPGPPTGILWTNQLIGTGTRYNIASGQISTPGTVNFPAGNCLPSTSSSPASDARPNPAAGTCYYYMVKSSNNCGAGTYGTPARNTHPACP